MQAKRERYLETRQRLETLLEGETDAIAVMATVVAELHHGFPHFSWVGFYRVVTPGILKVGPYQGGHGCLTIPFDRGVCGQCAREKTTQVITDVSQVPHHIACSDTTRSEIVVPILDFQNEVRAVLDIDSDEPGAFDDVDREHLEELARRLRRLYPAGRSSCRRDVLTAMVLALASLLSAAPAWGQTGGKAAGLAPGDYEPTLPLVLLEASGPIGGDRKTPCAVRIVCPQGAAAGATNRLSGQVKFHGATSQGYPKKSFSFSLVEAAPLLDLRKHDNWVLNAAYIDRSLMRHKLSYDLFRSLSATGAKRFAPASRFIELFLNGRYHGVYLLMERVDRQLLELRPCHTNDASQSCLYKAVDHAANFGHRGHGGYEQREPDPLVKPYWQPLDELNRFVSATSTDDFGQPQTGIEARLDVDYAIDFHLLVLLTSNSDGITKNFFLARDQAEPGRPDPRFFFVPWDYDGTFGRNWDGRVYPPTAWLSNYLFERLLGQAAYRDRYVARWRQLRQREFSVKTVQEMIDTNGWLLGVAAERNVARWPLDTGAYPDKLGFAEDLAQMKAWVAARLRWLDQQFERLSRDRRR